MTSENSKKDYIVIEQYEVEYAKPKLLSLNSDQSNKTDQN
jgi:hypothetical protein